MIEEPIVNPIHDYHVVSCFIQAERGHPFIKDWQKSYEVDFRTYDWGYNNAIVPWELSGTEKHRHSVLVLPQMLGACFLSSDDQRLGLPALCSTYLQNFVLCNLSNAVVS